MHSKNDNIEIMTNDKADEVIDELFESLLSRYQIRLETSTTGSNFIFDCLFFCITRYGIKQILNVVNFKFYPDRIKIEIKPYQWWISRIKQTFYK